MRLTTFSWACFEEHRILCTRKPNFSCPDCRFKCFIVFLIFLQTIKIRCWLKYLKYTTWIPESDWFTWGNDVHLCKSDFALQSSSTLPHGVKIIYIFIFTPCGILKVGELCKAKLDLTSGCYCFVKSLLPWECHMEWK